MERKTRTGALEILVSVAIGVLGLLVLRGVLLNTPGYSPGKVITLS